MANTFKFSKIILQEAALQLYNELQFRDLVHLYSAKEWKPKGVGAVGPTVDVPLPVKYLAKDGPVRDPQSIEERTVSVTIDQDKHVGLDMAVFDMTLNTEGQITKASDLYIKPAILTLADAVDDYIAGLGVKIHQSAGTAGTIPGSTSQAATVQLFGKINQIMTENGVPQREKKSIVLNPEGGGYLPTYLINLFTKEAQTITTSGKLGHALGFDIYMSNNVRRHTAGTLAAGALTNGVDQTGDTINIDTLSGAGTDNVKVGDIIMFAGVYGVNPVNKRTWSSNRLMEFRVTEAATEAGSAMAVKISPSVITSGAYQNVSNAVADGQAVTLKASHVAHMALIPKTLCLATMPLKMPKSAVVAEQVSYKGLSLMLTAAYDLDNRQEGARIDIIFGGREIYPETGVRLLG